MSHLPLEVLARLVDEAPGPADRLHLEACPACRAELEALTSQRDALRALPDLAPSPDAWPRLRAVLREEGLVRPSRSWTPAVTRAAAAVVLFLAGGAMGYAVRGPADAGPGGVAGPADRSAVVADAGPAVTATGPAQPAEADEGSELFMSALDQYMARSAVAPGDPAARLAALDNIVLTTAEALNEAPADPVIVGYHQAALAQRDAVLRQLVSREPIF